MKNPKGKRADDDDDDMLPEYDFDYSKAKPNRFAARLKGDIRMVVLAEDVARVFHSSDEVNKVLRALLKNMPVHHQK